MIAPTASERQRTAVIRQAPPAFAFDSKLDYDLTSARARAGAGDVPADPGSVLIPYSRTREAASAAGSRCDRGLTVPRREGSSA